MVDVSTKGQLVVLEVGGCKELLTLYQVDVLLRELKWASAHASAVRGYLATLQVDGVLPDGGPVGGTGAGDGQPVGLA